MGLAVAGAAPPKISSMGAAGALGAAGAPSRRSWWRLMIQFDQFDNLQFDNLQFDDLILGGFRTTHG